MFKFFLISLIIIPCCIFAQSRDSIKTYQLSDVVISATRTGTSLSELANSITIIDSAEIQRRNQTTVFDLLKDEYGISFTQEGGPGKLASVFIRGSNSNHTLVLVDGVAVNMPNDPGNSYDFSYLTPDNVDRVEVLRGPQSTLYGSNAMAGVINIITKKGNGPAKFLISGEGGSYGTYRGVGGLNGSSGLFNYSLSLSRFKTGGFSSASSRYGNTERDGFDNYNLSSRFGFDFSDNFNLNFFYRFSKGSSDLDQGGGIHQDDPTYVSKMEEFELKGEAGLSLFDGLWKQTLGLSIFRNVRKSSFDKTTFNPNSSRSIYDGRNFTIDWQNSIQFNRWNLVTIGIESINEEANSEYLYSYFYYNDTLANRNAYTTGLYIQDQIKVMNNLFTTVGVRFDRHNRFGDVTTYRIAPVYILPETGTRFKFTYGTAFHSPSLYDLYDPAYGNVLLKPERNNGWDLGFEQNIKKNKFSFGMTYFNNQFKDLFGYNGAFKTINIDRAETYGLEFFTIADFISRLKIRFNYTYTYTQELEGPEKDLPLLRRPENKIDLIFYYSLSDRINTTAEIISVGERIDKNFITYYRVTLPSYAIVNLSASYTLLSNIDIYGRVDNLFNTYYEEIYGYGTPGLSGYLGFKLNF